MKREDEIQVFANIANKSKNFVVVPSDLIDEAKEYKTMKQYLEFMLQEVDEEDKENFQEVIDNYYKEIGKIKDIADFEERIREIGNMEERSGFLEDNGYEDYLMLLEDIKKFPQYSTRNVMLLNQQKDVSLVKSFKDWKKEGIAVKKGEKALSIYLPTQVKTIEKEGEYIKNYKDRNAQDILKIQNGEYKVNEGMKFLKKPVLFDISQTTANPEEYSKKLNTNENSLNKALHKYAESKGYEVLYSNTLNNAYGTANSNNRIKLLPNMPVDENNRVLLHELAHLELGHLENKNLPKQIKEFEAETTSYLVSAKYGIENHDSTMQYLKYFNLENLISYQEIDDKDFDITKTLDKLNKKSKEMTDEIDVIYKAFNLEADVETIAGLTTSEIASNYRRFKELMEKDDQAKVLEKIMLNNSYEISIDSIIDDTKLEYSEVFKAVDSIKEKLPNLLIDDGDNFTINGKDILLYRFAEEALVKEHGVNLSDILLDVSEEFLNYLQVDLDEIDTNPIIEYNLESLYESLKDSDEIIEYNEIVTKAKEDTNIDIEEEKTKELLNKLNISNASVATSYDYLAELYENKVDEKLTGNFTEEVIEEYKYMSLLLCDPIIKNTYEDLYELAKENMGAGSEYDEYLFSQDSQKVLFYYDDKNELVLDTDKSVIYQVIDKYLNDSNIDIKQEIVNNLVDLNQQDNDKYLELVNKLSRPTYNLDTIDYKVLIPQNPLVMVKEEDNKQVVAYSNGAELKLFDTSQDSTNTIINNLVNDNVVSYKNLSEHLSLTSKQAENYFNENTNSLNVGLLVKIDEREKKASVDFKKVYEQLPKTIKKKLEKSENMDLENLNIHGKMLLKIANKNHGETLDATETALLGSKDSGIAYSIAKEKGFKMLPMVEKQLKNEYQKTNKSKENEKGSDLEL